MAQTFNQALLWHMEKFGPTIAELSRGSGVSVDAIKKLRQRPTGGTGSTIASKIAAYYGKSLEQFMQCQDAAQSEDTLLALIRLLTEDERVILLRQVRGMIAFRD